MIRSIQKWQDIGEQDAAADIARNIAAGNDESEIRAALAYHHCDDLDNAEITEQTPEARDEALDALVRGYTSRYAVAA